MGREVCFTNQFDVDLCEDICKVSSITMRFPKTPSTNSGDGKYKTWQPGQPVYGNITFEGISHPSTVGDITSWVKQNYNGEGQVTRKKITVNVRQHQQETAARTFNLIDTFPTSFSYVDIAAGADAGAVQHWTLEVRVQRIEMQ